MAEFEITEKSAEHLRSKPSRPLGHLAMSAYTLFHTPEHKTHHRTVEDAMAHEPQPLNPDVDTTATLVEAMLSERELQPVRKLSLADKMVSAAHMVQFSDHFLGETQSPIEIEYDDVKALKDSFVEAAHTQEAPLRYDQQLQIALELTHDDTLMALTLLCYASRQYARWLDTKMLANTPELSDETVVSEMTEWRQSLMASKSGYESFQDPAGDSYYAWTHALAAVTFGSSQTVTDAMTKRIFARGTDIMHSVVHAVNKQSVPNDHRIAAEYGNAIGDKILAIL